MELFLSSSEYKRFEAPRKILGYEPIKIGSRKALKAKIDIPVIGQDFGYGGEDLDTVYLVGRFDDDEVFDLRDFPIHVHVLIPKPGSKYLCHVDEFLNIGWACIYNSLEMAKTNII